MYLAQERELLKSYVESHELDGIVRDGYGMYTLSMVPGKGNTAAMGDEVIYQATVYLLDDSGVAQYTDTWSWVTVKSILVCMRPSPE
jgi:hypothetical protein